MTDTLIGTVVGFLLAALWQVWQKWREDKEERDRVRILLDEEMDFDAALLRNVRDRVRAEQELYEKTKSPTGYSYETSVEADPWGILGEFQPRILSLEAWRSQLSAVPKTLKEAEIRRVFQFYSVIEEIIMLQDRYLALGVRVNPAKQIQMKKVLEVIDRLLSDRPHLR